MKCKIINIKSRGSLIFLTLLTVCLYYVKVNLFPYKIDLAIVYETSPQDVKAAARRVIRRPLYSDAWRSHISFVESTRRKQPSAAGSVNCSAVFHNDHYAVSAAKSLLHSTKSQYSSSPSDISELTHNCEAYLSKRGYFLVPVSREEVDTPLAFTILFYSGAGVVQFERLLRSIYRPHNTYCVHVDLKASHDDLTAIRAIVSCFDNVFLSSKRYMVYWGHISILHAELTCMRDLLRASTTWVYLINLSAQMFPLHSIRHIARYVQSLNGTNDLEAINDTGTFLTFAMRHIVRWQYSPLWNTPMPTLRIKEPPPFNITLFKGSQQGTFSRQFVRYVTSSDVAHQLLDWLSDTLIPDEHFWSTLNFNRHLAAPGSYAGDPYARQFMTRYSIWHPRCKQRTSSLQCDGQWVRNICIFNVGDLYRLYDRAELFANKFFLNNDWVAYDCIDELVLNRTLNDIDG